MFCSQPQSTAEWNPHMEDFLSEHTKGVRHVSKCQQKTKQGPRASRAMGSLGRLWAEFLTQLTHPPSPEGKMVKFAFYSTRDFAFYSKGQPQPALTQKRLPHSRDEEENEDQEAKRTSVQSSPYFSAQHKSTSL